MATLFRCEVNNTNPYSDYRLWEIETVAEWVDEQGDENLGAIFDGEQLEMLEDVYQANISYGVYGRRWLGEEGDGVFVAEHIKDFTTIEAAKEFIGRLNGKEVG